MKRIHRILLWLNYNILPLSYNLWKEDKDEIYNDIDYKLKSNWIDCQVSIFSGMFLPVMILLLGLFFESSINALNSPWLWRGFIIYLIFFIFKNIKYNDKYVDEKYLMLSQKKKVEWPQIGLEKDFEYIFRFKNGKIKKKRIKFLKNPKRLSAGNGGPIGITYDKLFFEFKGEKKKIALLWHEFYHSLFKAWFFRSLKNQKGKWREEFKADEFSALNNSINDCLIYLKTIKRVYKKGKAEYNPMNHPPIDERIKRVEELRNSS